MNHRGLARYQLSDKERREARKEAAMAHANDNAAPPTVFLYCYRTGDDKTSSNIRLEAVISADRPPRGLTVGIGTAGELIFPRLDAGIERRFRRALRRGPIALDAEPGELAQRFGAESDDHIRLEIARLLKSGIAQRCRDGRYVCLFDALA